MANKSLRPTFFNLALIRFQSNAVASILHRLSGITLSLLIPVFVYLFDLSLRDEESFSRVIQFCNHLGVQLVGIIALWALIQHILTGIRLLLFDAHIGVKDCRPSRGAYAAIILAIIVTLLIIGILL
ncbi:succinate dehydrogenase cytochrome b556 subunit [Candidatus Nitrosoglobus terrae]|uniref:Succinate dehydrogenase cytochrome b556 subunit n=1 Tax=Candidatus Nitrosoglobus terrae TaxID=1630141 RepID=A0A1Q2SNY8_9GAMM|nr:succinate dehydrogenase, cytochrome b556 subunit [Candidatus Nitrosoglobus terrae]BAW80865.1 succinate dehydrogenase cytochrome b556 subunit [Candidatus Nitrosoglobus terrae]